MDSQFVDFKEMLKPYGMHGKKPDRHTKELFSYLFTAMRGGLSRMKIVMLLLEHPHNTNQIAKKINMDYKAIQHHMRVLEKNNIVCRVNKGYGSMFHTSNLLEANIGTLYEMIEKLELRTSQKKVYY